MHHTLYLSMPYMCLPPVAATHADLLIILSVALLLSNVGVIIVARRHGVGRWVGREVQEGWDALFFLLHPETNSVLIKRNRPLHWQTLL